MTIAVRAAARNETPQVITVLADAFCDDPAMAWLYDDEQKRRGGLERYFDYVIERVYLPKGGVLVTDDLRGAVLFAPPGQADIQLRPLLGLGRTMLPDVGVRAVPRTIGSSLQMDRVHRRVTRPHWYIAFVGVEVCAQRHGLGGALLRAVTEQADAQGFACYLEATSVENAALYRRSGFEPIETLNWPWGGPEWFPMIRSEIGADR